MSIKGKNVNKKINITNSTTLNYPVFCFRYITNNNKFNFKFITDKNQLLIMYREFYKKLYDLSNITWETLHNLDKKKGLEYISIKSLNFEPNDYILSQDDKFISIRFCQNKYRMICIKSKLNKDVIHIIGFDFNYSAYKH